MNLLKVAEVSISYSSKISAKDRKKIRTSEDAAEIFKSVWPGLEYKEYFYIMLLNRANHVIGISQISAGGTSGTVTDVKIIFQTALKANASGIILAHNHPSGNMQASDADIKITKKIKEGGSLLDISVLDHLILTQDEYLSMADENMM